MPDALKFPTAELPTVQQLDALYNLPSAVDPHETSDQILARWEQEGHIDPLHVDVPTTQGRPSRQETSDETLERWARDGLMHPLQEPAPSPAPEGQERLHREGESPLPTPRIVGRAAVKNPQPAAPASPIDAVVASAHAPQQGAGEPAARAAVMQSKPVPATNARPAPRNTAPEDTADQQSPYDLAFNEALRQIYQENPKAKRKAALKEARQAAELVTMRPEQYQGLGGINFTSEPDVERVVTRDSLKARAARLLSRVTGSQAVRRPVANLQYWAGEAQRQQFNERSSKAKVVIGVLGGVAVAAGVILGGIHEARRVEELFDTMAQGTVH